MISHSPLHGQATTPKAVGQADGKLRKARLPKLVMPSFSERSEAKAVIDSHPCKSVVMVSASVASSRTILRPFDKLRVTI